VILGSGIDTQLWQPVAKMAKVNQPVKVIMVGRLLIHKGVREYLAMAKVLKQKYQDRAEFWLIGDYYDGNPYNMSKELMDNAIKQGEIKFLSWSDRVRELLAESDIFVLPSYREGVPRTALEAAAMGKPIVTTDAVGCKEVVVDGVNGYLVPVQDSQVLSEKVGLLIENAALREKMGLASRKLAEERFDVQAVIKQYLAIYH
jgi:N,N'-diacetylbacillosaminyl-diphospho-undecaprenol alpha-1,3-N-acetylgalactosaminyltransferase